ncbi:tRNA modification GTPase MnmE [Ferriphaselus amnicola]|uniref:tRNA modification GTPase MnmE n=1 Tax=Ferriphaselus amnicola TaxID=1188319 RepID=A0A2Z6G886_9PROT|nr:tRNA uridine-5-carboxymethylaminomethyl(34) synthesis GTPase MnmE [Ferriphaselus amnicola]BBE49676.1 tRNA modification GTPase MnmE [Ferriphaselus amnicola]
MQRTILDNIAAIATAPGRGGIGVVRISGHGLTALAQAITGKAPAPRHATYASFLDSTGLVLDQGIALFFPAPHSYTGEDVLELQGHGGPAVLQAVLQRCVELGARLARPGEFTERAFLNNKLDLAQAESVADLIDATTTQAARSAMRSLQGDFSRAIHALVDELIRLRMLVEAMLDFPEEDVDAPDLTRRNRELSSVRDGLERVLTLAQQGSLLREGAHIVLVGQPNVGKSSLLNRLSGEEVALVSDIPGTTRDVIRQAIQLEGVPLHILDTAGLRESQDIVEQMGIARTRSAAEIADLILVLLDATQGMTAADRDILAALPPQIPRLFVFNKCDLMGADGKQEDTDHLYLSAKTGTGLDELRQRLLTLIGWHQEAGVFMARERHLRALKLARRHLAQAASEVARAELFAEELRLAQEALNSITGEFTADDLLGEIFSRFCIGK